METSLVVTFLAMGAVTYLPRALPMLGLSRFSLPRPFLVWLSMVPAAVLAALTAQSLVISGPHGLTVRPVELAAAIPCLLVSLRTRSMSLVVLLGMVLVLGGRRFGLG